MRAGDKQKVAGDNQGCEDNSSNINSISCELNDAMDIDALIDSGHKRRKTSIGQRVSTLPTSWRGVVLHWSIAKKEELIADALLLWSPPSIFPLWTLPPPAPKNSLVAPAIERIPIEAENDFSSSLRRLLSKVGALGLKVLIEHFAIIEMKSEECGAELAAEKERCITAKTELRRVDFDALADMDMSSMGFYVLNLSGSALDSFVAIWKGELFVNEREGSSTTDMAPYAIGDVMNLVPPSVTRGVIVASSVVEGVALVNAD
ncbi:hypothetical protein GOBAR_AA33301 [Gossypium barbadense]|uniref:Uncharacterized protein n=1 Tax=Gossypium barbadense TaxID=3634 RepID=A0A2P5W8I1_GOSBA|nr:hypothetical protein GOBAR_AA33301 [Gossypium barbadense]